MNKKEANERLGNNEPITKEMADLLDIGAEYIGATKQEIEEFLGIEFIDQNKEAH